MSGARAPRRARGEPPRILAVVFHDYGELGNAVHFLDGLADPRHAVLLLPPALAAAFPADPRYAVRTYTALDDVAREAARLAPDVALLFSGHFLTAGDRLRARKAVRLIDALERAGCAIVTSDPFLGLLRGPTSLDFSSLLVRSPGRAARLREAAGARLLSLRLAVVARRLRHAWKLYPAPPDLDGDPRRLGYFSAPAAAGDEPSARTWLFVLAAVDHEAQVRACGAAFADHVAARLADAARLGARPVLIGPAPLVATLRSRRPAVPAELLDTLGFRDYMARLRGAEVAFYWNRYSFSILHRVAAGRPALFFDAGHMVRLLPGLDEAGLRMFYRGWRPPLLSVAAPLDPARLAAPTAETLAAFAAIRTHLATGLAPDAVVERVLAAPPAPVSG